MGRPFLAADECKPAMSPRSTFSPEYAEAIITGLSQGIPLTHTCRELGVGVSTVYDWMKADETFAGDIARARVEGYDVIAEDCLRIADTTAPGVRRKVTEDGIEETTEDMLGHRKLQVETRLKLLAKWDPKRYGERTQVEHTGKLSLESLVAGTESKPE